MKALLACALIASVSNATSVDKGFGTSAEPAVALPKITSIAVGGQVVWKAGDDSIPTLKAGDLVVLQGENFGDGPDADLSKVMVGQVRALERDLQMYLGRISIANLLAQKSLYYETSDKEILGGQEWPQTWQKDIVAWTPTLITFRVPVEASRGPIVVQVQKKLGVVPSPLKPNQVHLVPDPITERVTGYAGDNKSANLQVALVGSPVVSNSVNVKIVNPKFAASVKRGEQIYWAFDFNIGSAHHLLHVGWDKILSGNAIDPMTGKKFDPAELLGAIKAVKGQVPDVALNKVRFSYSPMPSPIKNFENDLPLVNPNMTVDTRPTGWVGYVQAKPGIVPSVLPFAYHTGFNCAACHTRQISYENEKGQRVTKVFAGLPNPKFSIKFSVVSMLGVSGPEETPNGPEWMDKSRIAYALFPGTAEMTLLRSSVEKGSFYRNDFLFSPTAIPIITKHTPVRRALSRSEAIAGFEGSYIHSQEPDGAMGAHPKQAIQDLTAYMSTLEGDHDLLVKIGMWEWLKFKNLLGEIGNARESVFLRSKIQDFPKLRDRIAAGAKIFQRECISCHAENFGTFTDENMMPFQQIGTYFSPTGWQRQVGSIRTAMIRELFWVQQRGLMHDGHIRSGDAQHLDSAALLVHPDRCDENSKLYKALYTLNAGSFRIPKGSELQEKATRAHHYFVDLPNGNEVQRKYLYWDYQKMRSEFGVAEFGASSPIPLPKVPHGYCVRDEQEVGDLVHYLMTL